MEYPTLITSAGPWMTPPGVLVPEIVTVHELGHQWFYGLVGHQRARLAVPRRGPQPVRRGQTRMGKWRGDGSAIDFARPAHERRGAPDATAATWRVHDEPVAQPADALHHGRRTTAASSTRARATLVETLRRVYGDEPVLRALGRYARRFRFQHPGPEELLAVFEEVLGARGRRARCATALFEQGLGGLRRREAVGDRAQRPAGMFDRAGERERGRARRARPKEWDNAVLVRRRGTLVFPVDVDDDDGRRDDAPGALGRRGRVASASRGTTRGPARRWWSTRQRPRARSTRTSRTTASRRRAAAGAPARTLERATYWMQLALQAVPP